MKRPLPSWCLLAPLAALTLGCPGGGGSKDGGADSGENPNEFPLITVAGQVFVHPEAARYLADAGYPALSLGGLTVRVEEPLKVALDEKDPSAVFGTRPLDDGGTFSVPDVRSELVTLGIAAGVRDDQDAGVRSCPECGPLADGGSPFVPDTRVIRSATVLYDVTFWGGAKPDQDVRGTKAYALPSQFHAKLTAAVTPERILQRTGRSQSTLVGAGFVLGRLVDTAGNPVAGLKVAADTLVTDHIYYPSEDLSTVTNTGTSANGLFIYLYDGDERPSQFQYTVKDHPEYKARKAGAVRSAGLVVTVFPGDTEP